MMQNIFLGIILVFMLSVIDYISEIRFTKKIWFASFAAGISASYIFLHLMPSLYLADGCFVSCFILLGFVIYHVTAKYITQHASGKALTKKRRREHAVTLFIYHLFIGMIIMNLTLIDRIGAIRFFLPVALHIFVDELPKHIHFKRFRVRIVFASATLIGGLISAIITLPSEFYLALFGFVAGMFLFVEIRELMPSGRKGSLLAFVTGIILYLPMLLL